MPTEIRVYTNAYVLKGGKFRRTMPNGVTIILSETDSPSLVFFDDGSSSGGKLTLVKGRHGESLYVNKITGLISEQQ